MPDLIGQWLNQIPRADLRVLSMLGIGVHWWILQYTIGLSFLAMILELSSFFKNRETYRSMAETLSKAMAIVFAVGAATGTMSEFGLVLLWPNLTVLVGKYFFFPLYLEVFAFMAETIFVYMYFYTWGKVKEKFHLLIGIFAATGAFISALMIISVNSLMQMPPGLIPTYDPATGTWHEPVFRLILPDGSTAEMTSSQIRSLDAATLNAALFATVKKLGVFGIVFSLPNVLPSFLHGAIAGILVAAYTVLGVYAYKYFKVEDKKDYYLTGIKFLSLFTLIAIAIQGFIGDALGKVIAIYTPEKMAAIEGTSDSILSIPKMFGLDWIVKILAYGNPNAHLPNYDAIPQNWRPPIFIHYVYYTKMGLAILLGLDSLFLVTWWFILKKEVPKIILKLNILAPIIVHIVSTFGWGVREVGRKPWTVYGIVRVDEAATPVPLSPLVTIGIIIYLFAVLIGTLLVIYYVLEVKGGGK